MTIWRQFEVFEGGLGEIVRRSHNERVSDFPTKTKGGHSGTRTHTLPLLRRTYPVSSYDPKKATPEYSEMTFTHTHVTKSAIKSILCLKLNRSTTKHINYKLDGYLTTVTLGTIGVTLKVH